MCAWRSLAHLSSEQTLKPKWLRWQCGKSTNRHLALSHPPSAFRGACRLRLPSRMHSCGLLLFCFARRMVNVEGHRGCQEYTLSVRTHPFSRSVNLSRYLNPTRGIGKKSPHMSAREKMHPDTHTNYTQLIQWSTSVSLRKCALSFSVRTRVKVKSLSAISCLLF